MSTLSCTMDDRDRDYFYGADCDGDCADCEKECESGLFCWRCETRHNVDDLTFNDDRLYCDDCFNELAKEGF